MENDKLKPCPFCGGRAKHVYFRFTETHSICCRNCGGESNEFDTEEEAIEAWNTRSLTFPDEVQEAQHHLCELERITGEAWRPERTCRMEYDKIKRGVYCSHCGERMDVYTWEHHVDGTAGYLFPFCYWCGAKVVE